MPQQTTRFTAASGASADAIETRDYAVSRAVAHFGLRVREAAQGSGSYSSTVRILTLTSGERVVLKIPYAKHKLYRELSALEALKSDLPVPEVIEAWIPEDETPGALLLSFLPGVPATGNITPELAYRMGALIATVHQHPLRRFGDVPQDGDRSAAAVTASEDCWSLMLNKFDLWRSQAESVMPPDLFAKTVRLYGELAENLPEPDGPVWIHSDYRPGNVLVEENTIMGLIDFESARGGSADHDFVKISHRVWDRWPNTIQPFLDGYASVRPLPPFERTLRFYQLHNALGGVAWCVRRTSTHDPFFEENMTVLEQLTKAM